MTPPAIRMAVAGALLLLLPACAPQRAMEAMRVLQDIDAGPAPTALKRSTPEPERKEVAWEREGRSHAASLYRPGEPAEAALLLVPGAAAAGRHDRRMVDFAETMARARFIVLVPDVGRLRDLQVQASDARDIADGVVRLAEIAGGGMPLGIAAISYAVGPAVLALQHPEAHGRVDFLAALGGYYDIEAAVTFFTTGAYRSGPGEPWRYMEPNAYGRWVFVHSNAERVGDRRDAILLKHIAIRRLDDANADTRDLESRLGERGSAVMALLQNRDPERVPELIAGLPQGIREEMRALDLAARDLSGLDARLLLVHGTEDAIIPYTESVALAGAVPRADLFVVEGFGHVEGGAGSAARLALVRVIYRLLELRDGLE